MNVEDCLPVELRGSTTAISRVAAGLSGAGVYRVEAGGEVYVLKIAAETENEDEWRRALAVQRLAAGAGLAPAITHVDETRRAVLTTFIADRSFPTFYRDPSTHATALALLGRTVRRLHALPLPNETTTRHPREFLAQVWSGLPAGFPLPAFAGDAVRRVLTEDAPNSGRAPVLSHNDLNPTNLVYDGEAIRILDWASAGPMDPFYDLAVLAVFLRMDEDTGRRLLSAYDGAPFTDPLDRFRATCRLVAALAGTMQLYLARQMQHAGATGAETLAATLTLGEFYQQMRAGTLRLGTPGGQWAFGLALLKESLAR